MFRWLGGGGGVKIFGRFTNILWEWGEWVLCSWRSLLWLLRLPFMYNLILFNGIFIELSLTIFLAKYDTGLDKVMTRSLIWTASTAVALWICFHWVQAETPNVPKVFLLSLSSAQRFRHSAAVRPRRCFRKFFPFPLFRPTDQLYVVGEHRGKIKKERRQKERRKERYTLTHSVKIRIL